MFLTCSSQPRLIQFVEKSLKRNSIHQKNLFSIEISTTRSQKRKNIQQEISENVSEGFVSPVIVGNSCPLEQDVGIAGPSNPKSRRVENSLLENLRVSPLKEEITSEIKNLLIESQKEMLKLLKPDTRENVRENVEEEMENETRSFYTPTKLVRISSTQNDPNISRNRHFFENFIKS